MEFPLYCHSSCKCAFQYKADGTDCFIFIMHIPLGEPHCTVLMLAAWVMCSQETNMFRMYSFALSPVISCFAMIEALANKRLVIDFCANVNNICVTLHWSDSN